MSVKIIQMTKITYLTGTEYVIHRPSPADTNSWDTERHEVAKALADCVVIFVLAAQFQFGQAGVLRDHAPYER